MVAPGGTVVPGTKRPYEYGITSPGKVAWRYPRKVFSYSTPAVTDAHHDVYLGTAPERILGPTHNRSPI